MNWYFAYGSNMNAVRLFDERLKPEGVVWGERVAGRLDGWQLAFNKAARGGAGAGAGNIVLRPGAVVHGALNALPEQGFAVLDRYEGVAQGHYERRTLSVVRSDTGQRLDAITYVALRTGKDLKPTRAYLAHLLAGRDLLPADYWAQLKATPTVD